MVPKKEPDTFRRIHDLSYPSDRSVNDSIRHDLCSVQYETLDHITSWVVHFGAGVYIAKCAIGNQCTSTALIISYQLLGFKWNGAYYNRCLPMGCSVSCHFKKKEFSSALIIIICDIYIVHYSARSCSKALYNIIYNIIIPD